MHDNLYRQLKLVFNKYVLIFYEKKTLTKFWKMFFIFYGFFGPEDIHVCGLCPSSSILLLTIAEFTRKSD